MYLANRPPVALTLALALSLSTMSYGQLDYAMDEGVIVEEVVASPWSGSFAAGLNGKTGNSVNTDLNMSLNLTRETDVATTNLLFNYFYSSNDIATTTDRAFGQLRRERKLSNPRLSWYNQVGVEADRFKDFDYRIALHTGLSNRIYEDDNGFLKLRLGAGASREVGSFNDEWNPELQLGADWERQLTDVAKLYASLDYFPNVSDFSDYRINTNTGLDFVLDAERNVNFRLFALNRYDSTPPPGNNASDLEYGAALVVGF